MQNIASILTSLDTWQNCWTDLSSLEYLFKKKIISFTHIWNLHVMDCKTYMKYLACDKLWQLNKQYSVVLPVRLFIKYWERTLLKFGNFSIIFCLFIIFTHRSNIIRMMQGNENRFEKAMIFRKKLKSHQKGVKNADRMD